MAKTGIGIIGVGNISKQYLDQLALYDDVEVRALGDLDPARAAAAAETYGIPVHGTADDVLASDVDLVINLTIPSVHAAVSKQIISAGKHVWSEKPLAMNVDEGRDVLQSAAAAGKRVGCAPDTVLGPGFQTTLARIKDGEIGQPFSGLAIMQNAGPDLWHPNPDFFFAAGGGPTLDIGPYYLTSLVLALGPVTRILATGGKARTIRTVIEGDRAGQEFPVEVPTTVQALLEHDSGASSVVIFSFDSAKRRFGVLEFTGTRGSIAAPDPNWFGGTVEFTDYGQDEGVTTEIDPTGFGRGIGAVDMLRAEQEGRHHRCNGDLALHVLDIMVGIEAAVDSRQPVDIASRPDIVDVPGVETLKADHQPPAEPA